MPDPNQPPYPGMPGAPGGYPPQPAGVRMSTCFVDFKGASLASYVVNAVHWYQYNFFLVLYYAVSFVITSVFNFILFLTCGHQVQLEN